jgi:hypothetical protein
MPFEFFGLQRIETACKSAVLTLQQAAANRGV